MRDSISPSTTNFEIYGALTNGSNWTEAYEIQVVYASGGLSAPVTTLPDYYLSFSSINVGINTNGPVAPGNFYGYPDSTGTNIFLTWSPVSGAVTNYIIYGGVFDYTTDLIIYKKLGQVDAGTNSFTVVGGIDGSGNNLYRIYNVVAVYTNRSLSQSAAWYSGNGAPAPGALYAWLDSTGPNVQLSWSAATGAITGYLIQRSDYGVYYTWTFYEVGQVDANTTSLEDVDAVDTGSFDPNATVYEVQATYPNGGLSPAVTATVTTNVSAPSGLSATVDATGTNAVLTWTPALGTVLDYIIERGIYNPNTGTYSYSQIATVSASTTSYEDVGAVTGGNSNNNIYGVIANYGGGQLSSPDYSSLIQTSSPLTDNNLTVTAQMVRNGNGRWQLVFSSIPSTVQKIAFYWYWFDYYYGYSGPDTTYLHNGAPLTTETDIPVSSLTNGIYVLPDFMMTNWFPCNAFGKVAMVQPIGANNHYGNLCQAGFQSYDSLVWVDGRQHMKQNMLYQLRSATISQPNAPLSEYNVWWNPFFWNIGIPVDTNYVESSFFHWSLQYWGLGVNTANVYMKMDNLWPFTVNYELHQNLYDPNYTGPSSFNWDPNPGSLYSGFNFSFQGTLATVPAPAVLGIGDPYWISQQVTTTIINPATGLPTSVFSSALNDLAAYTNNGNLYLESGVDNLFGLPFEAALVNQGGTYWYWDGSEMVEGYNPPITLAPGGFTAITNVSTFFSQTVDPNLSLVNYYFAPVNTPGTAMPPFTSTAQSYPLPVLTGFASTNQTGVMITSVGTPTVIGGWAKFAIQNGSASKFAYLGQYYVTNAPLLNANGTTTTNSAGIVSPYGEFFPLQAGLVAMVTMPDIDTGAQGTGVVRVISLNADANHDGTLDFSYFGPDQTSPSRPFRFWANDNKDWSDDTGDGVPGQGAQADGVLQVQTPVVVPYQAYPIYINNGWQIHGRRDLVDFFPVYLNIGSLFQSNALSAGISVTDTNWQFVLSQADGALRFAYTDLTPTNYMNFLRDITESSNLAYATLTIISNSGVALSPSFVSAIATNNEGIILVEAAAPTTQPLVLTIYHGSNQIAQTSLYLSISGVEQMFRHKNLLLDASAAVTPSRLTDASVPNEPDTTDVNFIFLHGYNVNPDQARGWDADIYKRLYWSGSHAKFYGVTWTAADSQVANAVTINLQTNIVHAFATAPLLNTFLNGLTGTNVVAAHSLGNMLMLSTLNDYSNQTVSTYMMIDAAVAIEAIDSSAPQNPDMYSSVWTNYQSRLWSSQWHNLFPANDGRSTLTWSGRLSNLQNASVYNFYSSGEEVLRDYPADPPKYLLTIAWGQFVALMKGATGEYAWAWQEKCKGLMSGNGILSSDHGGWKFNDASYGTNWIFPATSFTHMSPTAAALLPNAEIQTNAFFDVTDFHGQIPFDWTQDLMLYDTTGSSYAQTNRNRLLSDTIPCLTLPVGANPVSRLAPPRNPTQNNFDMQTLENGWPQGRLQTREGNNWHHSDCRQVAYTFTYQLFNDIVTIANLK